MGEESNIKHDEDFAEHTQPGHLHRRAAERLEQVGRVLSLARRLHIAPGKPLDVEAPVPPFSRCWGMLPARSRAPALARSPFQRLAILCGQRVPGPDRAVPPANPGSELKRGVPRGVPVTRRRCAPLPAETAAFPAAAGTRNPGRPTTGRNDGGGGGGRFGRACP